MSYSNTYHLDCVDDIIDYNSGCCVSAEFGRVRSVAFIRKRYLQQILADPTNLTVWTTGLASGDIVILPLTSGKFDSGFPVKLKGFGRRLSTHGYRDMLLSFTIPAAKGNYEFFDDLDRRRDYVPAYRTGTLLHICDAAGDILTKENVEDDIESEITWGVDCTVRSKRIPIKIEASTLLSLFACDGITVPGGSGSGANCNIVSDFWITTPGTTEISGPSAIWGYDIADIDTILLLDKEGGGLKQVFAGTPGDGQYRHNKIANKVIFDPAVPFEASGGLGQPATINIVFYKKV